MAFCVNTTEILFYKILLFAVNFFCWIWTLSIFAIFQMPCLLSDISTDSGFFITSVPDILPFYNGLFVLLQDLYFFIQLLYCIPVDVL